MSLERERFGGGYIGLFSLDEQLIFDSEGLHGPRKNIPDFATVNIIGWYVTAATEEDRVAVVIKDEIKIRRSKEFLERDDFVKFTIYARTGQPTRDNSQYFCKTRLPNGMRLEGRFDGFTLYGEEGVDKEPYLSAVNEWKIPGENENMDLLIPTDPNFLSRIGFSFSTIL